MTYKTSSTSGTVPCDDLDSAINQYTTRLGYRLDMIVPADAPRAAVVSKDGETLRLVLTAGFDHVVDGPPKGGTQSEWVAGRAGMEYRDLIPGRIQGKMIASHIRLTKGGPVADYVHFHKVDFQMIYCLEGSIKVVYEDQGPPFWLEPGDCVLQPPEIRHRVLESTAGAEVIEIGSPAVHETWVEHDLQLPTACLKPMRDFRGQRFVRHIATEAVWAPDGENGFEFRDTGIRAATNARTNVRVLKLTDSTSVGPAMHGDEWLFYYILSGEIDVTTHESGADRRKSADGFVIPANSEYSINCQDSCELLEVAL